MHSRDWLAMALLTLFAVPALTQAQAQSRVTIQQVVPYRDGVGNTAIRAQCKWNTQLSTDIVADSHGLAVATDQDLTTATGPTLHMIIVNVHAAGGGNFSGPKWGVVDGELRDHGKLLGSFTARRQTSRGFTACSSLKHVAKTIAEDVAEWLKAPSLNAHF